MRLVAIVLLCLSTLLLANVASADGPQECPPKTECRR